MGVAMHGLFGVLVFAESRFAHLLEVVGWINQIEVERSTELAPRALVRNIQIGARNLMNHKVIDWTNDETMVILI